MSVSFLDIQFIFIPWWWRNNWNMHCWTPWERPIRHRYQPCQSERPKWDRERDIDPMVHTWNQNCLEVWYQRFLFAFHRPQGSKQTYCCCKGVRRREEQDRNDLHGVKDRENVRDSIPERLSRNHLCDGDNQHTGWDTDVANAHTQEDSCDGRRHNSISQRLL